MSSGKLKIKEELPFFTRDVDMKIVSQEIGTINSSVPIEYAKISSFLPLLAMLWFGNIENDGDSVFVILSNRALIG